MNVIRPVLIQNKVCTHTVISQTVQLRYAADADTRFVLLTLLSRHAVIKGLILELCNKSIYHRHMDTAEVADINLKVARWANETDHAFESSSDASANMNHFHQAMLNVLRQESVIALNRPILTVSKDGPDYNAALQACISASRAIIRTLSGQIQLHELEGNAKTPLVWPSFTWATWMSAFIVIYAANEGEIPLPVAIS